MIYFINEKKLSKPANPDVKMQLPQRNGCATLGTNSRNNYQWFDFSEKQLFLVFFFLNCFNSDTLGCYHPNSDHAIASQLDLSLDFE